MEPEAIRAEFVRLLTTDSETNDARRRDFNQAVFFPDQSEAPDYATRGVFFSGRPVWSETTLGMVMEKFDRAVDNVRKGRNSG